MNLGRGLLFVQALRQMQKDDLGIPLSPPVKLEGGEVIEDDGFIYPGDWIRIGPNLARLLAQRGDVKFPASGQGKPGPSEVKRG